jgi:hypothetical protein
MTDKDFIGFHVDEDTPTAIDFKYNKASAGGVTTVLAAAGTLAADTWVKLGFVVDMLESNHLRRVKAYVDGVELGTYVTNAAYETAAAFPTGEELHAIFGGKNNNAAKTNRIDWIRIAQLKSGN